MCAGTGRLRSSHPWHTCCGHTSTPPSMTACWYAALDAFSHSTLFTVDMQRVSRCLACEGGSFSGWTEGSAVLRRNSSGVQWTISIPR